MSSEAQDQALVRKYLNDRDERSFRELYRRHTPSLYALAVRLCGSDVDAQDAIQETWVRACARLISFKWRSSLRTWLTGVLINCVRERRRERLHQREEPMPDDWPGTVDDSCEQQVDLEQAIARLPDGYREVLTLHDIEGYTHEEIAMLLELNAGTSKSQLHHARKALRTIIDIK